MVVRHKTIPSNPALIGTSVTVGPHPRKYRVTITSGGRMRLVRRGAAKWSALVRDLQGLRSLGELLLSRLLDRFRALRERRLVEQGQERREAFIVDQPEDLDIALRGRAPASDIEGALGLGEEPVIADVRSAALRRPAPRDEQSRP